VESRELLGEAISTQAKVGGSAMLFLCNKRFQARWRGVAYDVVRGSYNVAGLRG